MTDRNFISGGEIILSGNVISDDLAAWGYPGFAPSDVRGALAMFEGGDVTIRLNSIGGYAAEGEAIRAMIARHDSEVTIVIEGSAQSAASLLALGADRVEISAGSFVMIHDPSGGAWGTAEELRAEADALEVLAGGYAEVYAARLQITPEAARDIMRAETFLSAKEAVEIGFASSISGAADADGSADMSAAISAMRVAGADAAARLSVAYQNFQASGRKPLSQTNAAARGTTEEPFKMANTPNAAPSQTPTHGAPDMAAAQAQARTEERSRISTVRLAATPFLASGVLTEADLSGFIDSDASADAIKAAMLDRVSERQSAASGDGVRVQITRDETDTKLEGMISAMSGQTDGPASDYRGLRVKSLARTLGGAGSSFNESEVVRRGMSSTALMGGAHGVSDFSYITAEVMGRRLADAYTRRPSTWEHVTGAPISASDFRELAAVSFGGDFSLKPVDEDGEYKSAVLDDKGEGLKVERRGRTIILTFEAVMNDDMGAFARIPDSFSLAARQMESSMVWGLIRANAKMKSDQKALFHTDHKNLASAAAALSISSVGLARKLMWEQKAHGSKDADDFIQVTPNLLIVPPALETVALQFVAGTTPGKDSDANPYKGTMSPVIVPELSAAAGGSDTSWYLGSTDLPAINAAYLDGYQSPTVTVREGMNPDRVVMDARHIFGAAPGEFRGMAKNAGA